MCGNVYKDYFNIFKYVSDINRISELLKLNGPDSKIKILKEILKDAKSITLIFESLRDSFCRLLNTKSTKQTYRLSLNMLSEINSKEVTWVLNSCLRKTFSRLFSDINGFSFADGNDWNNDRDALLSFWRKQFLYQGLFVKSRIRFVATSGFNDEIFERASADRQLDFSMPNNSNHESLGPVKYINLKRFPELYNSIYLNDTAIIVCDIASLKEWKNPFTDEKLSDYFLMFLHPLRINSPDNILPIRYDVCVDKIELLKDFFKKYKSKMFLISNRNIIKEIELFVSGKEPMNHLSLWDDVLTIEKLEMIEEAIKVNSRKFVFAFYTTPFHHVIIAIVFEEHKPYGKIIYYVLKESITNLLPRINSIKNGYPDNFTFLMQNSHKDSEEHVINAAISVYLTIKMSRLIYDTEIVMAIAIGIDMDTINNKIIPIENNRKIGEDFVLL